MTQNRRIFWNIIATYGRSLYALIIGLFCGRWTLMALGQTDYGLMGLIGGLTMFISYFNNILASAIGRFFAISVGESQTNQARGLESCHRWFTTAVVLHTLVPILLVGVGYPVGVWAIQNELVIPSDRIQDCVWVWRFVCTTCFVGMVTVPFNAMYTAKQYIAELTIYSFITTTINAGFLYYMVMHPGMWLVPYMLFTCALSLLPQFIISIRACYIFKECRFKWKYVNCFRQLQQLGGYSLWTAWGVFGGLCRDQGLAVQTNVFFGPRVNAGLGIGNTVSAHCNTLSGSMTSAFSPAIINAWGAGDYDQARSLAYRMCKLGTFFILIFALPLFLEVEEVLCLWLKNPPPYAAGFCLLALLMALIERLSIGQQIMVNARGKVALYQCFAGTSLVLAIPICWGLVQLNFGPYAIGWAMVISMSLCTVSRIILAKSLVKMSVNHWIKRIAVPLSIVSCLCLMFGAIPRFLMPASFLRIVATTFMVEIVLLPCSWIFILDKDERQFITSKIARIFNRAKA